MLWLRQAITVPSTDCILWPFWNDKDGYGTCWFEGKTHRAHRLAFYLHNGRWPVPYALHSCDVRACINPSHIGEGDAADNYADARSRDRNTKGKLVNTCRLTPEIVRHIRMVYSNGSGGRLAREFGVTVPTIHNIVTRKTWKHVT